MGRDRKGGGSQLTSVIYTAEDLSLIEAIKAATGVRTRADIVRMAIRDLHRKTCGAGGSPPPAPA